jgi:hypothetical protein
VSHVRPRFQKAAADQWPPSSRLSISLGNVDSIQKGAYILSPLQEAGQDAEENYGFKLFFRGSTDDTRLTSYTVRNERHTATPNQTPSSSPAKATAARPSLPSSASSGSLSGGLRPLVLNAAKPLEPVKDDIQYFAFKGISRDLLLRQRGPSVKRDAARGEDDETDDEARTCKEAVNHIVTRLKLQCSEAGSGWDVSDKRFVVDDDVRSLGEAERETSWSSRIEYGISTSQAAALTTVVDLADLAFILPNRALPVALIDAGHGYPSEPIVGCATCRRPLYLSNVVLLDLPSLIRSC